jgi:hypothetical protein
MAYPRVYVWPAPVTTAITALGDYNTNFPLNGTLSTPNSSVIAFDNYSRTISITSVNNHAAVNFTINGIYNGANVTQTIAGPNNNTVFGTQLYDTITSITAPAGVRNGISFGTGQTGHTRWYLGDYNKKISCFSFQVVVANDITYSLISTLMDVTTNTTPFAAAPNGITFFDPTPANSMTLQAINLYQTGRTAPLRYMAFKITASTTGSLTGIILENG